MANIFSVSTVQKLALAGFILLLTTCLNAQTKSYKTDPAVKITTRSTPIPSLEEQVRFSELQLERLKKEGNTPVSKIKALEKMLVEKKRRLAASKSKKKSN